MSEIADIVAGRSDDGKPCAYVGEVEFASIHDLVSAEPILLEPESAEALASFVTHFARNDQYQVIDDPTTFETAYRAKLETEDPSAGWQQNVMRLTDFGVPDFTKIKAPTQQGGTLVFFARDALTGLPYKVAAAMSALDTVDYAPVGMTPVAIPAPASSVPQARPKLVSRNEPSDETETPRPKVEPEPYDEVPDDLPNPDDIEDF